MKIYKQVNSRETMSKELHKELNLKVGPTRLVRPELFLVVDVDELQKQTNTLENKVNHMERAAVRKSWRNGSRKRRR